MNRNLKQAYIIVIFVLVLCLQNLNVLASENGFNTDEFVLDSLIFKGIKHVSEDEIKKILESKEIPFWMFWEDSQKISLEDVEDDIINIKQFYKAKGYYHTKVTYKIDYIDKKKNLKNTKENVKVFPKINVIYLINEGKPVIIDKISLILKNKIKNITVKSLKKSIKIKTGDVFDLESYKNAKKKILRILGNNGYPLAKAIPHVIVNTHDNKVFINITVFSGKKYYFGHVKITGNNGFIDDEIVKRALDFTYGQLYSVNKVEDSQKNLNALDAFFMVSVKPDNPIKDSKYIPILVSIKRKEKQGIKLGAGYGSDDGFRALLGWTYRNILGLGGGLSIDGKHSNLIDSIQTSYNQPYFLAKENTLNASLGFERENYDSYTNNKIFDILKIDRKIMKYYTVSASQNISFNILSDVSNVKDIYYYDADNNYFVSSLALGIARDTSDNAFYPTKGSIISASVEEASKIFASQVSFFKPTVQIIKYHLLFSKIVFAGRCMFRTVQKTEGTEYIPIFERLFLGGINSVRGYGFRDLGPKDDNGNPLGGLSSFDGNVELRFPVYRKIHGVTFFDMGLLEEKPFKFDFRDMRYTCGVGLQYNTIIGPICVDFGYQLNPYGDISWSDSDRYRVQFSIGQAF